MRLRIQQRLFADYIELHLIAAHRKILINQADKPLQTIIFLYLYCVFHSLGSFLLIFLFTSISIRPVPPD